MTRAAYQSPGPAQGQGGGRVPAREVLERVRRFQERLAGRGAAGALVTGRTDRYYLTGTAQEGSLWVPSQGDPVLWVLRDPGRAARETPLPVEPVAAGRDLWARARRAVGQGLPGIVADVFPAAWLGRLGLDGARPWVDVSPDLLEVRRRKSPWEVERMAAAAAVAARVYEHAAEVLRPGMTEAELGGLLFARAMALGHEGFLASRGPFQAYSWHVVAGAGTLEPGAVDTPMPGTGRSPAFPVGAGDRPIRRGEPVVVDFGVSVWGYQTDQTRTLCVGPPPEWLREAHAALLEVHRAVEARLAPGTSAGEVFRTGAEAAVRAGLGGYLGPEGRRCRFVGHGVGLETVEPPILAESSPEALREGDSLAVEPKAVVAGLGGVGVEDTYVLGPEGPRRLTAMPWDLVAC